MDPIPQQRNRRLIHRLVSERRHFDRLESIDAHENDRAPGVVRGNGSGTINALVDVDRRINQVLFGQRGIVTSVEVRDDSTRAMTLRAISIQIRSDPIFESS